VKRAPPAGAIRAPRPLSCAPIAFMSPARAPPMRSPRSPASRWRAPARRPTSRPRPSAAPRAPRRRFTWPASVSTTTSRGPLIFLWSRSGCSIASRSTGATPRPTQIGSGSAAPSSSSRSCLAAPASAQGSAWGASARSPPGRQGRLETSAPLRWSRSSGGAPRTTIRIPTTDRPRAASGSVATRPMPLTISGASPATRSGAGASLPLPTASSGIKVSPASH
jgi:hypothetical protein